MAPIDLFDGDAYLQRWLRGRPEEASVDAGDGVRRWIYGHQIGDQVIAVVVGGEPVRLARDRYRHSRPIRFTTGTTGVAEWLLADGRILRLSDRSAVEAIVERDAEGMRAIPPRTVRLPVLSDAA